MSAVLRSLWNQVSGSVNTVPSCVYSTLKTHNIVHWAIKATKRGSQGIAKRKIPVWVSGTRPLKLWRSADQPGFVNNNNLRPLARQPRTARLTDKIGSPSKQRPASKNHLQVCSLNPWSVCNKTSYLQEFICDHNVDILALTETWLTGSDKDNPTVSALLPDGYSIRQRSRKTRGGGTALVYRSSLNITETKVPQLSESFETLDCLISGTKAIRLSVVYRPPPSKSNKFTVKQFLGEFAEYLAHLVTSPGHLIILGDFNFHVNDSSDRDACSFQDLLSSYDLHQHVKVSTHCSGHTLDLVLTRSQDSLVSGLHAEDHGFPDHYPVFTQLSVAKPQLPKQEVTYRKLKCIDIASVSAAISASTLCTSETSTLSLDEQVQLYNTELSVILDKLAPLKTRTITIRPEAVWYNNSIREAKQRRRKAERIWRRSGLTVHRDIYMVRRAEVNDLIEDAKKDHYSSTIAEHKGDSKQLFKVVNKLLGKSNTSPMPSSTSDTELASMFSDFFVQKITKIRSSIVSETTPTHSDIPSVNSALTKFTPLTVTEVAKLVRSSASKSCELDPLPTSLVKETLDQLAPSVTSIVNASLCDGTFPHAFKSALVTPLLKKSTLDPDTLRNYRPVSNLAFISKVIEKAVASQLNQYLKDNDLLEPCQSAYRQGHSTETALMRVQNDIICAVGERKAVMLVLLDLSAAFDTVDHACLNNILQGLGITGTALRWFRSYLENRQQIVNVRGKKSDPQELDCGVPQGSVLGPILFTVYTSSLGQLLRHHLDDNYHLYADDSQLWIILRPNALDSSISRMEECVAAVQKWMSDHHLKMNNEKTEFLLIASKQVSQKIGPCSLRIGDNTIRPSSSARNIGVVMDSNASMEAHIRAVCKTCYMHIYNLNKLKRYIDRESLEYIVHAFITSKLDYCNALYCGLPETLLHRLQLIQNTTARILSGSSRHDSITPVLYSLHWLPVEQRVKFKVLMTIYKCINNLAPRYLQELLQPYVPSRQLRSSDHCLLKVPYTSSAIIQTRAFSVAGPRLWNELPYEIRTVQSVTSFKSKLKTYLFKEHFNQ